jgi:hypothetical protein
MVNEINTLVFRPVRSTRLITIAVLFFILVICLGKEAYGATPGWANKCGDGRVDSIIDNFEDISSWSYCCMDSTVAKIPVLSQQQGCSGNALSIDYSLTGGTWFVILKNFNSPLDLSTYTHLRLALRSSSTDTHFDIQVKLVDNNSHTYWIKLISTADLPVWRPVYIDLREFTCFDNATCNSVVPFNYSSVRQIQIAISRCYNNGIECELGSDNGILYLDELAAVDLSPGSNNRLVQTDFVKVNTNTAISQSSAKAILDQNKVDNTGLVPAWFEETPPNYNTYSEAVALLVYVKEYQRTKDPAYKTAANSLASKLVNIQIPDGKVNAGAFFTAYKWNGSSLTSSDSSCTGDETAVSDIDRCFWIGNTAWAVIAMHALKAAGISDNPQALDSAISKAANWMLNQIGRISDYPHLVTIGLEGNISTYFGLLAAGKITSAKALGDSIYALGWDTKERRFKIDVKPSSFMTSMDTSGSWGVQLLRSLGKDYDALASLGYTSTVLRTSSFDGLVDGYGDIAGAWTPTVEFGAQGAAAGILDANYVMNQIFNNLQKANGSFPGSPDNWYGGDIPAWNTTMTGVAPTAWVYFALNGDPLIDLMYPTAATLISPTGKISTNTPTYTWNAVYGTAQYLLWVNDSTGNVINKWYTASQAGCSSGIGTCSVTPNVPLALGDAKWWILSWNSIGYGPWSDRMDFTAAPPDKAIPISPIGKISTNPPTYIWNPVSNSTWYYLWVNDSTRTRIRDWYKASDANCASGTGTCSVTPNICLANGDGSWWIQTWNSIGYGPWSDRMDFTLCTAMAAPVPVLPIGTSSISTPAYAWPAVCGAEWYYLWVNDSTGNKIKTWYTASQAGCASGIGTCYVIPSIPLASGAASWWILPWNSCGGNGPWSTRMDFTVSLAAPPAATLVSPTGSIATHTPTYIWNAVSGSTWYFLWVNDSTGNKIKNWYSASDATCASGTGTCSVTPSTSLASGAASWWIQTWNSTGEGPWSTRMDFTVQ